MPKENKKDPVKLEEVQQDFYVGIVERNDPRITEEKIHEKLGDIHKNKPKRLTDEETEIIRKWEEWKLKDLPEDWQNKYARFIKASEELGEWKKVFGELKPVEVKKVYNEPKETHDPKLIAKIPQLEKDSQDYAKWQETTGKFLKGYGVDTLVDLGKYIESLKTQPTTLSNKEKEAIKFYDAVKDELVKWTKQFGDKTPEQVQLEINLVSNKNKIRQVIEILLWDTQDRWRKYLESNSKGIFDKDPVLGVDFDKEQGREQGRKIVSWIIKTLINNPTNSKWISYEQLAYYWTTGKEQEYSGKFSDIKYNASYDYDTRSLWLFLTYLGLLNKTETEGNAIPVVPVDPAKQPNVFEIELKKWTDKFPFDTPQSVREKCDRLQKIIDYEKTKLGIIP